MKVVQMRREIEFKIVFLPFFSISNNKKLVVLHFVIKKTLIYFGRIGM